MRRIIGYIGFAIVIAFFAGWLIAPPSSNVSSTAWNAPNLGAHVIVGLSPKAVASGRWVTFSANDGTRREAFVRCDRPLSIGETIFVDYGTERGRGIDIYFARCIPLPVKKTGSPYFRSRSTHVYDMPFHSRSSDLVTPNSLSYAGKKESPSSSESTIVRYNLFVKGNADS